MLMMRERRPAFRTIEGWARTIVMTINNRPGVETTCDALTRFADLYSRLCRLADFAAGLAPFAATPLEFVDANP